jgi:hypothetical protein
MSTIPAIVVSFVLIALALAPLVAAYRYPRARLPAALLYGMMLTGVAVYYTGLSLGGVSVPTVAGNTPGPAPTTEEGQELTQRCREALEMAEQGSLIRDKSDPQRLVVDRALWGQLPAFVKETLVLCLERSRPPAQAGTAIEVIEE